MQRRTPILLAALVPLVFAAAPLRAQTTGCTLQVGLTLADLPTPNGVPDQGTEGLRFMGYTLNDALVNWDLSRADQAATLAPGLATSWTVDPADRTRWTIKLRPGVRFHDGSAVDADAVVWNLDKVFNKDAPQYGPAVVAQVLWRVPGIAGYRKLDDMTVEITTKGPDATLPYQLTGLLIASPSRWREVGSWEAFARNPSGTGPWKAAEYVPRDHALLARNDAYWDKARMPRCAGLMLRPVPDATTRTAALLSGQLDWIESSAPDTVERLKAGGMAVVTGTMPHSWPYTLNRLPGSPLNDIRVRKALNLAIDRDGMVELLGGTAMPAKGMVYPGHPWFGTPSFDIKHDPAAAKALLAEAGYGPQKPLKLLFAISTAGSGQMQPGPMNDFVQQNLADVGVKLEFQVLEWEALRARRRVGSGAPENRGVMGLNNSWGFWDPDIGLVNASWSSMAPPAGYNWGHFSDPEADALCEQVKAAFDPAEQDRILARLHTRLVDQAMWVWVVHDLNPRALSPKVKGYVEAQSWFQDLTTISMG